MATSQHSAIRVALKSVLTTAGHTAYSYNPGDKWDSDHVYMHEVSSTQDWGPDISGNREETLIVNGVIRTSVPGADDADAKTAEDNALAILDDLETSLAADPTLGGSGFQVELIGPTDSEVYPMDNQRVCLLRFVVRATVFL